MNAINTSTDQLIRLGKGVYLFETDSDTVSLSMNNKRFKTKLFKGAGGGTFLIKIAKPVNIVLPLLATYQYQELEGETSDEWSFKRI